MTVDSTLQEDFEVLKPGADGEKVTSLSVLTLTVKKLSLAQCQRLIAGFGPHCFKVDENFL